MSFYKLFKNNILFVIGILCMCIGCLYMLGFTENELFKYIFFGGVMLIATSVLVDSGSYKRKK